MTKRKQVKNACIHCQKACKKCDEERPCTRCIKYGLATSCVDSPRKERGSKRAASTGTKTRRRRAVVVTDDDNLGEGERGEGMVRDEDTQLARPPVPPLRMHLKIDDPLSAQQSSGAAKRSTRRTAGAAGSTSTRSRRRRNGQEGSLEDAQDAEDHYQGQLASLRATYRISKPGNPNYRHTAPAVLPGMEAWDAAAAASTANHTLYMTAQYRTMAAISRAFTLPANIIRSASPIGTLAAVCADLCDKPVEFVSALEGDSMKQPLPSPSQQHQETRTVLVDASALALLPPTAPFPAPIPSRFPTPPETPIHQWVNHSSQHHQHGPSTAPGSPIKMPPSMASTIANVSQRARSTSPLSTGVVNGPFPSGGEPSTIQPSQLAQHDHIPS